MSQTSLEPADIPEPVRAAASPEDASLGDLVRNMSADLSRLVRNEMQLAQTEITGKLKHAGAGGGAFGGAGVLALYGVAVLERAVASVKTDVAEIKESIKQ